MTSGSIIHVSNCIFSALKFNKIIMKYLFTILLLSAMVACAPEEKKEAMEVPTSDNPLLAPYNDVINFAALSADDILDASEQVQIKCDGELAAIIEVADNARNFNNTMLALDDLYADFDAVASAIYLMAYTHTDSLLRANAQEANITLSKYINDLSLNEDLYKAVKSYSQSEEAAGLTGYKAKFLKEEVESFERNGFALNEADRNKLKAVNDEISEIGDQFSQNIAAFQDFLILSEEEMAGCPDDFKAMTKQEDGTYKVDLSYPSYRPFMKFSTNESARKELFMKYNNKAAPENLEVLASLLKKRREMANILGYDTYSEYRLADRMAKNPKTVWDFESKLKADLKDKTLADYEELAAVKAEKTGSDEGINSWETSFYYDILLKEKYQLDGEEVKQYFALDDVLEGLFSITQSIFDLEYKEVKDASVWHEDVRMFEVYKDGKLKGRFYLDLFPRENKYSHAACFGIHNGKQRRDAYQIPTASLVCNFPSPTEDTPSLMPHSQVNTFFHEFGHVLHHMNTTAELISQSGTSVSRDFVEAPSQIFENWTWNYEALKLFAKHHETREVLPEALFNKMLAAKNVGSGMGATRQVFLGSYDMYLHDKFDPNGEESTTDVLRDMTAEMRIIPYVEGTHFQCAFGHLNGYGSSYYGYMWSKVYAQDMFSVFEENGILDKETGIRYRDIILARGSSMDELELVKEFLGREPNNEAFLRELGL